MQYLRDINLETFIIVSFGIKKTNLAICDLGLLNLKTGKIVNRIYNSGSYGYCINRKFKSESSLEKYPLTKIIHIKQYCPF
jgi:hypothetical protein